MAVTSSIPVKSLPVFFVNPKADFMQRVAKQERIFLEKGKLVWSSDRACVNPDIALDLMLKDQFDLLKLLSL